jgi:hypothetical protein
MCLDKRAACCVRRVRGLSIAHILKALFSISSVVATGLWSAILPANGQVNVTQFHNHSSRDGLYIDPAFTQSAAANLARDMNFDGTIEGNVFAQPLYIEGGPNGPMIIASPNRILCTRSTLSMAPLSGGEMWALRYR